MGDSVIALTAIARFTGSDMFLFRDPGAGAPGFMLTPAIAG